MLNRKFDPHQVMLSIEYLRMSSDIQNPRSPDQQAAEIRRVIKACGYRWTIKKTYSDDALSGRLLRKRKGFQQMLNDIRTGAIVTDLILVDTFERFGRADELPAIRKELYEQHGVLLLTADTQFADPTTAQGRALAFVEGIRSTEDSRIKAHNVLRGKRDAARLKHWPGGPTPFGYSLHNVMKTVKRREEIDYSILVPDPDTSWIILTLFRLADEKSWGTTRLARELNQLTAIPDKHKPFLASTIGFWLDNPIYRGTLAWAKHCTGIVDDARVIERNAPEDVLLIPDFCEPLVANEQWYRVQEIREVRRQRYFASRNRTAQDGKQIAPLAQGLTLKYLLSGLVYCGACGLRMTATTSAYTTTDGDKHRYGSYGCPAYASGSCSNGARFKEPWLRSIVIEKLTERLFPMP